MKSYKTIIAILFSVFFLGLTSCGGGTKKSSEDTHVHDDGSVHKNHADDAAKPTEQESFKVAADSTTTTTNPAHDHGDGKKHKH